LRITKDIPQTRTPEENMSIVSASAPAILEQAVVLKSIVSNLWWFDGN